MAETLVGIIMFFTSFAGVLTNWTVVLFMKRIPSLRQSFGILTRNQAMADAFHASVECFLVVPMVILDITFLKAHSNILSFLLLISYDTSVLTHLLTSLNRFCAVWCPMKYFKFYNDTVTMHMVVIADIFSFITTGMIYVSGCHYSWSDAIHSFLYHADDQCVAISFYGLFCKYIALVCLILSLDILSISKARSIYGKRVGVEDKSSRNKRSKELFFLIQTCLQGMLFGCELVCYFLISPLIEDTMIRFFLTTFAYSLIHATDGALSILCNQEFRAFIFRTSRSQPYGSVSKIGAFSTSTARF